MKINRNAGEVIMLVFLLALLGLLVRPSSLAPSFIAAFGGALTALVGYAGDPATSQSGAAPSGPPSAAGPVYA